MSGSPKRTKDWRFGPLDMLIVVFVALKLTGTVDWPWLVVLLPLIVTFSIGFGAAIEGVRRSKKL